MSHVTSPAFRPDDSVCIVRPLDDLDPVGALI